MQRLTKKHLQDIGACLMGIDKFNRLFPRGAAATPENIIHAYLNDLMLYDLSLDAQMGVRPVFGCEVPSELPGTDDIIASESLHIADQYQLVKAYLEQV